MNLDKSNQALREKLSQMPFAQRLGFDELDRLITHSEFINFSAGEVILKQGSNNQGMYLIIDGTVLITAKILGEGGTYIASIGPGNLLGEISLLDKGPCATSALASTCVKCLLITNEYFALLGTFYPESKYKILFAIANEVCRRIQDIHNKISNFITQSNMITQSFVTDAVKTFTRAVTISLETTEIRKHELQQSHFFKAFSHDEFNILFSHCTLLKAPKKCVLLQADDREKICFIIVRGAVQSSIIQNNKIAKLSVLGPISLFCNMSCMDTLFTSIINYATCERAILIKFDHASLTELQNHHKLLWFKLFDLICESFVCLERSADKLDVRLNSELYNR